MNPELKRLQSTLCRTLPGLSFGLIENPKEIWLNYIYVQEENRGRGIARMVIESLQDYARAHHKPIKLHVVPEFGDDSILQTYYEKLGFQLIGYDHGGIPVMIYYDNSNNTLTSHPATRMAPDTSTKVP